MYDNVKIKKNLPNKISLSKNKLNFYSHFSFYFIFKLKKYYK